MDADIAALRERIRARLVLLDQSSDEATWLAATLAEFDMAFPEPHAIGREFMRVEIN